MSAAVILLLDLSLSKILLMSIAYNYSSLDYHQVLLGDPPPDGFRCLVLYTNQSNIFLPGELPR